MFRPLGLRHGVELVAGDALWAKRVSGDRAGRFLADGVDDILASAWALVLWNEVIVVDVVPVNRSAIGCARRFGENCFSVLNSFKTLNAPFGATILANTRVNGNRDSDSETG